jgi:ankyrin repeat protein
VRCADGSLDRAGFLGGTNDMMARSLERQAPWLAVARAKRREAGGGTLTQLICAVREGDEKRVRELVAAGAKLDLGDGFKQSALHHASSQDVLIVKLLLDGKYEGKGASVNLESKFGVTSLLIASPSGHEAVVRLLLERGADVTRQCYGHTALSLANTDAIKALLRAHGATA